MSHNGFYIKQNYEKAVSSYLIDQLNSEKIRRCYYSKKLGWIKTPKGNYEYLLDTLNTPEGEFMFDNKNNIVFKNGNLNDYVEFLKTNIFPYKETKLAFSIGLSAILNGYYLNFISVETPVYNFTAESSFGKTTMLELIASIFGSPKLDNYGFLRSFAGTFKSLVAGFKGRNGIALLLDDESAANGLSEHEKQKLIYNFSQNEPWSGCSSNGDLRDRTEGWSGAAILTSETPFISKDSFVKQGANNRLITLNNISWTQDALHSSEIKQGVRKNHGHFACEFVNFIKECGKDKLLKMRECAIEKIAKKINYKAKERIAQNLSSLYVTIQILDTKYPNTFDVEELFNLLLSSYDIEERDISESFLDVFKQYIVRDSKSFYKEIVNDYGRKYVFEGSKINGMFRCVYMPNSKNQNPGRLYVSKIYFDSVCEKEKVAEGTYILKKWKEKGIIDTETDKLTRRASALGNISCVVLKLDHKDVGIVFPTEEPDSFYKESLTFREILKYKEQLAISDERLEKMRTTNFQANETLKEITFDEVSIEEIFNNYKEDL